MPTNESNEWKLAADVPEARKRFIEAAGKLAKITSTAQPVPEIFHAHSQVQRAAMEWAMLEATDLKKAAADYLVGAKENAKWMRIATVVIAVATAAYVLVAFGQWRWPVGSRASPPQAIQERKP